MQGNRLYSGSVYLRAIAVVSQLLSVDILPFNFSGDLFKYSIDSDFPENTCSGQCYLKAKFLPLHRGK